MSRLHSGLLINANVEILVGRAGEKVPMKRIRARNMFLNSGLQKLRNQFMFPAYSEAWSPCYIALGTDSTAVAATDVALGNEVYRGAIPPGSRTQTSDTQGMLELYVTEAESVGYDLCEAGAFTEITGGEPWARVVFPTITKTNLIWIILRWYFGFSYVAA